MKSILALSVLFLSLLLVLGVALFFMWHPGLEDHQGVDKNHYERRLRDIAGPAAIHCAETFIPPRTGAAPPDCLKSAIRSGKPFFASLKFRPWGNHETFYAGLARDSNGKLWMLSFDPDRMGGWGNRRKPWLQTNSCRVFQLPSVIHNSQLCGNGR